MQIGFRRCVIDGRSVATIDDVYEVLAVQLDFPPHFGRNLDALWDTLTTDIPGPLEIRWEQAKASRKALKAAFDRIETVLREAADAREDLTFILTE